MTIRITGMNSGLDVEGMISELVKAQQSKVDVVKKKQMTLEYKQDAWKDMNTKIYNLFNKTLNNLRWADAYAKKATTVSHSNLVSVITGDKAVNGVQSMQIIQQAKQGYLTGEKLTGSTAYTKDSTLSSIAPGSFSSGQNGKINITVGGKTTEINVNGQTKISDVVNQLQSAGVNANFDEKNQRFFVIAKDSGESCDFTLTGGDQTGAEALSALGINASNTLDPSVKAQYEKYAGYFVAGDRSATLANMRSMIDSDIAAKAAAFKKSNDSIDTSVRDYQEKINKLKDKDGYNPDDTADSLKDKADALKEEIEGMADGDAKKQKQQELADVNARLSDVKSIDKYNEEIVRLNGIRTENSIYVDEDGNPTSTLTGQVEDAYYNRAEYADKVMSGNGVATNADAKRTVGQDAKIMLNGADFTSSTNSFEVNGLTLTVLSESSENITINTQDDTQGIYDMIKNFFKEYNTLINDMDKKYNADSAKGYSPLTDEEKAEMSDKEIEKWEQKLKDSAMRKDETLSSVISTMKESMMEGVSVGGKTMYLTNFGIDTLNYFLAGDNERGAYHIDGDPDDSNTSNNTDKLKTAIANDPDTVIEFFSGLTQNLYAKLDKQISASNDYKSFNSIYNDKQMKQQYDDYTTKIKEQEAKLTALQDKWYAKFSQMETALAKLQSNANAVTGLLGGS